MTSLVKEKTFIHHDNAPAHMSVVVMTKINKLGFKLLLHALYSPDLASSDYHLLLNLKNWIGGKKFRSIEEVIDGVNENFEGLDKSDYINGIIVLEHRYKSILALMDIMLKNKAKKSKKIVLFSLEQKLFTSPSYNARRRSTKRRDNEASAAIGAKNIVIRWSLGEYNRVVKSKREDYTDERRERKNHFVKGV